MYFLQYIAGRVGNMVSGVRGPQLPVFFYRTRLGAEPVREWLRGLSETDRSVIGFDLRRVQTGWPIGMPLCRSLGSGLWELRSRLPSNRIGRLIFFIEDGEIYVVHGFIKKTQKTPPNDIALALKRLKETKE
jgi:phage-related protein